MLCVDHRSQHILDLYCICRQFLDLLMAKIECLIQFTVNYFDWCIAKWLPYWGNYCIVRATYNIIAAQFTKCFLLFFVCCVDIESRLALNMHRQFPSDQLNVLSIPRCVLIEKNKSPNAISILLQSIRCTSVAIISCIPIAHIHTTDLYNLSVIWCI